MWLMIVQMFGHILSYSKWIMWESLQLLQVVHRFSATGQLWGNPLYKWEYHKQTNYDWWIKRIERSVQLYDVVRIDHFRGFDEYYSIPAGDKDATNGHWEKGPGIDLFNAIKYCLGNVNIIAEDLGYITDSVRQLVNDSGFPNMKVLEFAFDSRDSSGPRDYLPYNYDKNCVVYTGTHDNETLLGFFEDRGDWELGYAYDYLDTRDKGRMVDQVFRAAYSSVAVLTVFAVQDILKLGNWARMNLPSSMGNNWKWRMQKGQLGQHELECMRYLASVFDRERK